MSTYTYDDLEESYKQKAITVLGEIPERLQANILSLRRWLQHSPHITNCPTDDRFLLRFLRVAKFNAEKAQHRLENFCTVRGSPERGLPTRFDFPALGDPELEAYLRMGVHLPLGPNAHGETVILIRFSQWDIGQFSYERLLTFTFMMMEVLFADQRNQIAGIAAIIDLGDLTKEQNAAMMNLRLISESMRIWQEAFAFRNRQVIFYRESSAFFEVALELTKLWIGAKHAGRVQHVKNDLAKVREKIDGAAAVLPVEMGGENGSMEGCRARWEEKFRQHWSQPSALAEIRVDESKRPQDTLAFLKTYEEISDEKIAQRIDGLRL